MGVREEQQSGRCGAWTAAKQRPVILEQSLHLNMRGGKKMWKTAGSRRREKGGIWTDFAQRIREYSSI